jgi:putative heme degradation protein
LSDLRVFPNPNNGSFTVGFNPKSGQNISVQVYDIRGRLMYTNTYNSVNRFEEVINLNNAQSGVYLLQISDGPQKVTKKIIVN